VNQDWTRPEKFVSPLISGSFMTKRILPQVQAAEMGFLQNVGYFNLHGATFRDKGHTSGVQDPDFGV